ncbi:hypothetical protein Tco_1238234 [Tanacetum coccineum]
MVKVDHSSEKRNQRLWEVPDRKSLSGADYGFANDRRRTEIGREKKLPMDMKSIDHPSISFLFSSSGAETPQLIGLVRSMRAFAVRRKGLPKIIGTLGSGSKLTITKSARKVKPSTLTTTSSAHTLGGVVNGTVSK